MNAKLTHLTARWIGVLAVLTLLSSPIVWVYAQTPDEGETASTTPEVVETTTEIEEGSPEEEITLTDATSTDPIEEEEATSTEPVAEAEPEATTTPTLEPGEVLGTTTASTTPEVTPEPAPEETTTTGGTSSEPATTTETTQTVEETPTEEVVEEILPEPLLEEELATTTASSTEVVEPPVALPKDGPITAEITLQNQTCKSCGVASDEVSVAAYVVPWYPNDGEDVVVPTEQFSKRDVTAPSIAAWGKHSLQWEGEVTTPGRYYFVVVVDPENLIKARDMYRVEFTVVE
jgi:outer membrane biosynthesis protein TonB